jgi:hypothetical protein
MGSALFDHPNYGMPRTESCSLLLTTTDTPLAVLRSRARARYGLHHDFAPEATGAPASTNDKGMVSVDDPPSLRKLLANFLPSMEHFRHLRMPALKMKSISKGWRNGRRNLWVSFSELTELQTWD